MSTASERTCGAASTTGTRSAGLGGDKAKPNLCVRRARWVGSSAKVGVRLLQAEFADEILRQCNVLDLVVRFCREYLKGRLHVGGRRADCPQERSQGIKAGCPTEQERSHPILLAAEADQELRY